MGIIFCKGPLPFWRIFGARPAANDNAAEGAQVRAANL